MATESFAGAGRSLMPQPCQLVIFGAAGERTLESAREAVHHLMDEEFEQLKKAIARERRTGITQQFLGHLIDSTQVLLDFYEVPGGQKTRPDRLLKAG